MFTDTHAHLYSEEFNHDRNEMIQRALNEEVERLFLPNIDAGTVEPMLDLCKIYPENCFPMIGLHPCYIKEDYKEQLQKIEGILDESFHRDQKFYAIGEIGLDFYWDKTFASQQKEALVIQIAWAKKHQLPIVLHCRDSFNEVYEIVAAHKDENLKGVFHCFSGNIEDARKVIDLGFYLGIGGVLTFKNSGLDKVMEEISLDHIILETDAPYLAPVPFRGKRNESSFIKVIAQKIADIKMIAIEEVAGITTANSKNLFKI